MKLKSVQVQNFMGFSDSMQQLDGQGLVLVTGDNRDSDVSDSNGAGKSALFVDAIPWALYGETVREKVFGSTSRQFSAGDVVNRTRGGDCVVQVEFERGGKTYLVSRYRQHREFGNTVHLECGNVNLTGETIKETDEKIVQLIGLTYQAYCNSVVFAQGAIKRFSQCTDAECRKILEDFFDLSVFDAARALAQSSSKDLAAEISRMLLELSVLEGRITDSEDNEERLKACMNPAPVKVGPYNKLLRDRDDLLKKMPALKKASAVNCQQGMKEKERLRNKLRDVDGEVRVEETRIRLAQKIISKFRAGDTCGECGRPVTAEYLKEYVARARKETDDAEGNLEELRESRTAIECDLNRVEEKLDAAVEAASKYAAAKSLLTTTETAIASMEQSMREADQQKATVAKQLAEIRRERAKFVKQRDGLTKSVTSKQAEQKMADFWVEGFGSKGIKDAIHKRLVDFINQKLRDFSRRLTGGEIDVQLVRTAADKIRVNVEVTDGAPNYVLSSNGQARRVDLCIALALQAAAEGEEKANITVIDEFDAGLDQTGVDAFVSFLQEEAARKGSVFVISHNAHMAAQFDNVLTVRRENGESRVVQ